MELGSSGGVSVVRNKEFKRGRIEPTKYLSRQKMHLLTILF